MHWCYDISQSGDVDVLSSHCQFLACFVFVSISWSVCYDLFFFYFFCLYYILFLFFFFFFFNDPATPEIYTYDTLFPYTTLFRSRAMAVGSERPGPDRCGGQAQPDVRRPCPALAGRSASRLCHSGGHHHIRPRRRPPAARDLASAKWGSRAAGAGPRHGR